MQTEINNNHIRLARNGIPRGASVARTIFGMLAAMLVFTGCAHAVDEGSDKTVTVPANIDHSDYDRLLKKYVDDEGLVAYTEWNDNAEDRAALKTYLEQYAPAPDEAAEGDDLSASLINGYNAFAMDFILDDYPVDSIMALSHPFDGRRHEVGGELVSLDDIEHATLIPHFGYRAHGVLVCVARSCPPLQRFAYTPDELEKQVNGAFEKWLAREDLNRFFPDESRVEISQVFEWFEDDFEEDGGIPAVLARHGPEQHREFLESGEYKIEIIPYDWALNDQEQREFGRVRQGWNRFKDVFR